jgi:long-chain acyl-CoA synthetase
MIVGRKKDMLKVAGEIVFCPEVEAVIHRHPAVEDAAVIGMPDPLRGEVPKAFVVCKPGAAVTEDELRLFLKSHLAHFKIPHVFVFRNDLPKNRLGKIDKEALKKPTSDRQAVA